MQENAADDAPLGDEGKLDTLERAHAGDRAAAQAVSRFEGDVERPAPALPRARNAEGEVFRLQFAFGETVLGALGCSITELWVESGFKSYAARAANHHRIEKP